MTLFQPLFKKQARSAELLWLAYRHKDDKEAATKTMQRVRDLLDGKAKKDLPAAAKLLESPEIEVLKIVEGLEVSLALAEIFDAHKEDTSAEKYYRPNPQNTLPGRFLGYGDFLFSRERYKEAAEQYEKEWDINRSSTQSTLALYLQGRSLVRAGKKTEANQLIERALWSSLGNEYSRHSLIEELTSRDWPEAARKEADMVLQTGWYRDWFMGNIFNQLSRDAQKAQNYSLAANYYERALLGLVRNGVHFVEATGYLSVPEAIRMNRARALLKEGKLDQALEMTKESLKILPGNIDAALLMVPELERQKKNKEADALYALSRDPFLKLSKEYPNSAYARNSLAWLMANTRREPDEAVKHAQKAVELEPKNAGYLDTLAEAHFRRGEKEKAIELMKKCITMDAKKSYYQKQLHRFQTEGPESTPPDEQDDD